MLGKRGFVCWIIQRKLYLPGHREVRADISIGTIMEPRAEAVMHGVCGRFRLDA